MGTLSNTIIIIHYLEVKMLESAIEKKLRITYGVCVR